MKPQSKTGGVTRVGVWMGAVGLATIAHTARADEATTLDRVQVLGTREEALRTPAAVSTVRRDARRAGASGAAMSDLLVAVPGVLARSRHNFAQDEQISVRGFGTRAAFGLRGLRLYLDGIPATAPDGQGQVSHFNAFDLARVDVLRGPFSVLYGNASGGVIQAESRTGREAPGVSLDLQAGADAEARAAIAAGGYDAHGDWRLSASRWRTDGFREHSRAQRTTLSARVARTLGEGTRVTFVANAFDAPDAQDPQGLTREQAREAPAQASPSALAFDTRKGARQVQLGMVLEQDIAVGTLRLAGYGGERRVFQMLSTPVTAQRSPLSAGGVVQLRSPYAGLDARLGGEFNLLGRPLQWATGLDTQWQLQHREGFENSAGGRLGVRGALRLRQDDRVTSADPYVQLDWQASDALSLTGGLRYNRVRFSSDDRFVAPGNPDDSGARRFSALTPALGASLRVAPALNAYVSYGRGFETPTANELAYRSDGGSGPNLGLLPARTRSVEAGLKYARAGHNASVAVFESRTQGELTAATSSGGRTTFQNAGRARRQGVELSADWRLAAGWRLRGAASWLDARFVDAFATCAGAPCLRPDTPVPAGTRLPGVAARTAFVGLRRGGDTGWQFDIDTQYVGPVRVAQATAEEAPGYAVLGLQAAYAWTRAGGGGRLYAGVANAADRRYIGSVIVNESNGRYYEPAPGRRFEAGLEWRWRP